ncbi:MAG: molybdopterin-dependent oxidoreductase [Pseudomonadales bacterium]
MTAHVTRTVRRTCPTCEACCGLIVEVDDNSKTILSVHGDPDDPRSKGYVCAKSQAFRYIHDDPERLRTPVKKTDEGTWQAISWEEAFATIAERLNTIRTESGKDSIALYVGNPTGHIVSCQIYLQGLMQSLATERFFSAGTVDQHPQQMGSFVLYGEEWKFPIPDTDRTDYFIIMGANPMVSQGSLMSAPDIESRLKAIRARGGKVVVIDPRFTETSEQADQHIYIKPGTDAFMLMAFINEMFAKEWVNLGHLDGLVDGVDELRAAVSNYTPESTEATTGVSASILRQLVQEYCAARTGAAYGRIGLCTQQYGTLASWLVDVISLLAGKLDVDGGMMFPRPPTSSPTSGEPDTDAHWGRWKSRVRGFPETCGELPANLMAEEITATGEDKVRALITICGNPVLSVPNGKELREAIKTLDFMVALDIYINETSSQADIILPSTTQAEQTNYDLTFTGTSGRNFANFTAQLFEPEGDLKTMGEALCAITAGLNGISAEDMDAFMFEGTLERVAGQSAQIGRELDKDAIRAEYAGQPGWERVIDLMLRNGPYGDGFDGNAKGLSLAKLAAQGGSVDLGALTSQLPDQLKTEGKRIRLMHPLICEEFDRIAADSAHESAKSSANDMLLIGRRNIRDMNSWLHNIKQYVRGKNRCTMIIHSKDALRIGLKEGSEALVKSRVGESTVPIEISDAIMEGVVSIPHGFGHTYQDSKQSLANDTAPGISCNDLIDHEILDTASGTSVVNGAKVQVYCA